MIQVRRTHADAKLFGQRRQRSEQRDRIRAARHRDQNPVAGGQHADNGEASAEPVAAKLRKACVAQQLRV